MNMNKKVVFLDRDGTINVDSGFVDTVENWQWTPGALVALNTLQQAGFTLAVITNQSGIGHGLYTVEDMQHLHAFMEAELKKSGVTLAMIAYCPHRRDGTCDCRKPKIGMAKQIEARIGPIDYTSSWTIGDKLVDFGFGKTTGTKTALVRSNYWKEEDFTEQRPDLVVDSLADFAQKITHVG